MSTIGVCTRHVLPALSLAAAAALQPAGATGPVECELLTGGSVFLTGHDPDFHAVQGGNTVGARNINIAAINFIMDPAFNPFVAGGVDRFLFVESMGSVPGGHTNGVNGIVASGYVLGVDFDHHDFNTLNAALDDLGTIYSAIVVASDYGGILRQAELDILNARSDDIITFLNDGGGLYAMAESNGGAGLTPNGGHYGFLPFVVSSTQFDQSEVGITVTPFGANLGLTNADVNGNFSHNIFTDTAGLEIVDIDQFGNTLSLAGRGVIDPDIGIITDCNDNGIRDECDIDPTDPDGDGLVSEDCNENGTPDECDIADGTSQDCNDDGIPDECPACPPVEAIFVMDTSSSMNDEGEALCNDIDSVIMQLELNGITVNPLLLAISPVSPGCSIYSCLTNTVSALYGTDVPGGPPAGLETLGDCPPSPEVPCEDWGRATAVVAGLHPWQPGAVRLVVVLADEGPYCGNPVTGLDTASVAHAVNVSNDNDVTVSTITGTGSGGSVIALAQQLAGDTGGLHFASTRPASDLAEFIEALVLDACLDVTDCNRNNRPDECDIADGTSQDCNENDVPDECDIADGTSEDRNDDGVPDECLSTSHLDIKPGSCPNSFNRNSNGVLPVALIGADDFDVSQVDLASIELSRADGVGGSAAPNEGPPGPHSEFEDVASAFGGELCDCHELEGDGIVDLSMKFQTQEVVDALELNDLSAGDLVELTLTGTLLDGTPFEGNDCIRLVPPGTSASMLNVGAAHAPGAWIDAMPLDLQLDGGGFGRYQRDYPLGTVVTLSAHRLHEGASLVGWQLYPDSTYTSDPLFIEERNLVGSMGSVTIIAGLFDRVEAVYELRPLGKQPVITPRTP